MAVDIYLDNAATSFPKAPGISEEMRKFLEDNGTSVGRGGYRLSYDAGKAVLVVRQKLASAFGVSDPRRVIFTGGATLSLNMLLKGLLKPGDTVLAGSLEHNAVMRPLRQLEKAGVLLEFVPSVADGIFDWDFFERRMAKNKPAAVVMTHASNVCGAIQPIERVGRLCRERGVSFLVDAAQTAGVLSIDCDGSFIDGLAFSGHKGLMGPPGIGCMIVSPELAAKLNPIVSGGTGSLSETDEIPLFLPDKFEPGTLNVPAIAALGRALDFVLENRVAIAGKSTRLTDVFLDGISGIKNVRLIGPSSVGDRIPVFSIDFQDMDNADAALFMEKRYGILARVGLHCSPAAHKALETYPQGTVRLSPGYFNTERDIQTAIEAIGQCKEKKHAF